MWAVPTERPGNRGRRPEVIKTVRRCLRALLIYGSRRHARGGCRVGDMAFGERGEWGSQESQGEGNPSIGACRPLPCRSRGRIGADAPLRLLFQLLIVEKRMRLRTGHDAGNVRIGLA